MGYIQIYVNDKGFARITLTNKAEIEKLINNSEEFSEDDLAKLDRGRIDCEYCDGKYVFIKGEIITPRVVSKVTSFEID